MESAADMANAGRLKQIRMVAGLVRRSNPRALPIVFGSGPSGGLIALYGVACLIACAIIALSHVLQAWLSALIVGAFLLIVAAVAAMTGRKRMRQGTPPVPHEAVESVKIDVATLKQRVHRS